MRREDCSQTEFQSIISGQTGIMQVISSNASCSLDELAAEKKPEQELGWQ